ncbi:MAG: ATP-binding protein [Firmicutes bacterium]|nr:ATP-binding protein [Bacillota bacterium]
MEPIGTLLQQPLAKWKHVLQTRGWRPRQFHCERCLDTGVILIQTPQGERARLCNCILDTKQRGLEDASRLPPKLREERFENFSLQYYSADRIDPETGHSYRALAAFALQQAKRFAETDRLKQDPGWLLFMGEVGRGKTHLAASIVNRLLQRNEEVLFLVVPDFLEALRESMRRDQGNPVYAQWAYTVPYLVMDDLGVHNYSEWTVNQIYSLLNERSLYKRPTVVTTNLSLEQIAALLGARTSSRLIETSQILRLVAEEDIRVRLRREWMG